MSDLSAYRSALTKAALVGTRHSVPSFEPPAPFEVLGGSSSEEQILSGAAVLGLTQTAGRIVAHTSASIPAVAPAENRPYISPAAAWRATEIFRDRQRLLSEWLAAVHRNEKILPPILLPEALQLAVQSKTERLMILEICGERGRWLAQFNPEWASNVAPQDRDWREVWENGTRLERCAVWEEMIDLDGSLAREWMRETWATEDYESQAWFITKLIRHVVPEDEAFLEAALDSKLKEVREQARMALLRLPHSALMERAFKFGLEHISLDGGKLKVTLPEHYQKSWKRDSIVEKRPQGQNNLGDRAFWLWQRLTMVPPCRWTDEWGLSPAELCTLAEGEWEELLIDAWSFAAFKYHDVEWCRMFVTRAISKQIPVKAAHMAVLPDHEIVNTAGRVLERYRSGKSEWLDTIAPLLEVVPAPWSLEFSRIVLDTLRRTAAEGTDWFEPYLEYQTTRLGRCLPPEMHREVAEGWPERLNDSPRWLDILDKWQSLLRFRYDMLKELED